MYGGYIYIYIYIYMVKSIYMVNFIYIWWRLCYVEDYIYIDRVVLYIWKKSGRFNDMKYHGSYNKEFILYKFHFI